PLVRLTVSHVVLPSADASLTGERISRIALRYLGADPARPFTQRRFLSGC
ncbi:TetR/AcrR family transcriptional regulator, partial [Mycobacterium avium]|nr:TetR/AcrR family transcriptional regulator [Mycobacterium avium]